MIVIQCHLELAPTLELDRHDSCLLPLHWPWDFKLKYLTSEPELSVGLLVKQNDLGVGAWHSNEASVCSTMQLGNPFQITIESSSSVSGGSMTLRHCVFCKLGQA